MQWKIILQCEYTRSIHLSVAALNRQSRGVFLVAFELQAFGSGCVRERWSVRDVWTICRTIGPVRGVEIVLRGDAAISCWIGDRLAKRVFKMFGREWYSRPLSHSRWTRESVLVFDNVNRVDRVYANWSGMCIFFYETSIFWVYV